MLWRCSEDDLDDSGMYHPVTGSEPQLTKGGPKGSRPTQQQRMQALYNWAWACLMGAVWYFANIL